MSGQAFDAERALLGCAIRGGGDSVDHWDLRPSDFGNAAHREIAQSILALRAALQTIDPVLLHDTLVARRVTAIDLAQISDLADAAVTGWPEPGLVTGWATQVRQWAARRRCAMDFAEAARRAMDVSEDYGEVVGTCQRAVEDALDRTSRQDCVQSVASMADDVARRMAERAGDSGTETVLSGFPDIDKRMGGIRTSVLTVLGGRTSTGKSALARSIAQNVANAGHGVHVISLEDRRDVFGDRILSDLAGIPLQTILAPGGMTQGDLPRFESGLGRMRTYRRMLIEDQPQMTSASIAASVRRRKRENDTRLVVVDYVQRIQERERDPRLAIGLALNGLFRMAREERVAVLLLSQVNRENEKEARRPRLSDLKESGSIEEQASAVLLLHRREAQGNDPAECGVIIAKNKHGERDVWVPLNFDGPTLTYRSAAQHQYPGGRPYHHDDEESV